MNNMLSIGNDIVEIKRIRDLIHKYGDKFYTHIYTDYEVEWCNKKSNIAMHLAGRFAAKEAVKKALMSLGISESLPLTNIEIRREEGQPPFVKLDSKLSRKYTVGISISHTETYATAVAIAEKV